MDTLTKMIQAILTDRGQHILEGMQHIAERYAVKDFDGISSECDGVVWDISALFVCSRSEASNFFAAEMRERHNINVH